MAALSICSSCQGQQKQILFSRRTSNPKKLYTVYCQSQDPKAPLSQKNMKKKKKSSEKQEDRGFILHKLLVGVEKLGKGLKENLSPKQKGDWKDLILMSLSFAVYVYISQRIVSAYCAWTSMIQQPW